MTLTRTLRRVTGRGGRTAAPPADSLAGARIVDTPPIEIAPNDPILAYFHAGSGAVPIDELHLESPAVSALRAAGVKLVVPLISQGELIGLLNLGRRLSDQDYSTDDRRLLEKLAAQASPAVRVAQLVREQEAEVRARERIEQELRVAQLIQQQFLPKTLPDLPGWQIAAFYRAAAEVGGDFYDFIPLPDGKIALVVGDVSGLLERVIPGGLCSSSFGTGSAQSGVGPSTNRLTARVSGTTTSTSTVDFPSRLTSRMVNGLGSPTLAGLGTVSSAANSALSSVLATLVMASSALASTGMQSFSQTA